MDFILTTHAAGVIEARDIDLQWVKRCVNEPDSISEDNEDRQLRHYLKSIAERQGRTLRVIVNITAEPNRVVTAFFDRRIKQ